MELNVGAGGPRFRGRPCTTVVKFNDRREKSERLMEEAARVGLKRTGISARR